MCMCACAHVCMCVGAAIIRQWCAAGVCVAWRGVVRVVGQVHPRGAGPGVLCVPGHPAAGGGHHPLGHVPDGHGVHPHPGPGGVHGLQIRGVGPSPPPTPTPPHPHTPPPTPTLTLTLIPIHQSAGLSSPLCLPVRACVQAGRQCDRGPVPRLPGLLCRVVVHRVLCGGVHGSDPKPPGASLWAPRRQRRASQPPTCRVRVWLAGVIPCLVFVGFLFVPLSPCLTACVACGAGVFRHFCLLSSFPDWAAPPPHPSLSEPAFYNWC